MAASDEIDSEIKYYADGGVVTTVDLGGHVIVERQIFLNISHK